MKFLEMAPNPPLPPPPSQSDALISKPAGFYSFSRGVFPLRQLPALFTTARHGNRSRRRHSALRRKLHCTPPLLSHTHTHTGLFCLWVHCHGAESTPEGVRRPLVSRICVSGSRRQFFLSLRRHAGCESEKQNRDSRSASLCCAHTTSQQLLVLLFEFARFPQSRCEKNNSLGTGKKGKQEGNSQRLSVNARWPTYRCFFFLPACAFLHLSTSCQPVEPEKGEQKKLRGEAKRGYF